jgi:phosphoribosylaminoimidazole-succinocarboxamide synthase
MTTPRSRPTIPPDACGLLEPTPPRPPGKWVERPLLEIEKPADLEVGGATASIARVLALHHLGSGKVRDLYELDDDLLLMVASDRISAYDVVLDDPIPEKGRVLTGLSIHWFDLLETPHHLVSTDIETIEGLDDDARDHLRGRSMIVRRADVIPMECVVRGFLYGSSWKEYAAGGGPTTEHLPAGLQMADRLADPIFTPATKAESGHDENLTETGARTHVGDALYEELRRRSIEIYTTAADYAGERGILLADTKFEFGLVDGEIVLIDEVLTPDSSRYWPADAWAPGATMPSFDKQPVRDWLEAQDWDKTPPAPRLPAEVIADTTRRYIEAYERLSGRDFAAYRHSEPVRL